MIKLICEDCRSPFVVLVDDFKVGDIVRLSETAHKGFYSSNELIDSFSDINNQLDSRRFLELLERYHGFYDRKNIGIIIYIDTKECVASVEYISFSGKYHVEFFALEDLTKAYR